MSQGQVGVRIFGLQSWESAKLDVNGKLALNAACMEIESYTGTTDGLEGIQPTTAFSQAMAGYIPPILLRAKSGHTITVVNGSGAQLSGGQDVVLSGSKGLLLWQATSGDNGFRDFAGIPDMSGGIVDLNTIQTLTNKTLVSPLFTGTPKYRDYVNYTDSDLKQFSARLTTTDATVTTIFSTPVMAESTSLICRAMVQGRLAAGGEAIGGTVDFMVARGSGGNVRIVWSNVQTGEDSAGTPAITLDVDTGTQVGRIRVAGIAAATWYWGVDGSYSRLITAI